MILSVSSNGDPQCSSNIEIGIGFISSFSHSCIEISVAINDNSDSQNVSSQ